MRQRLDQRRRFTGEQRAVDGLAGFGLGGSATGEKQIGEPQRQAVDQEAGVGRRQFAQAGGQVQRLLDAAPVGRAAFTVVGDAARHLAVARFGGGDIDDPEAGFESALLGMAALARTGAAEDQFIHGHHCIISAFDKTEPGARQLYSGAGPPL